MLFQRMIGVLKLDVDTFEEIEHDQGATGQAAIVVLVVALVAGIGGGLGGRFTETSFLGGFLSTAIGVLVGSVDRNWRQTGCKKATRRQTRERF